MYQVRIGEVICEDLKVTMNFISCKPPRDEPDDLYENKPRVRVGSIDEFNK